MPRAYLKRLLPDRKFLERHPLPAFLTIRLCDSRIWHPGRRPVARGVGLGMFIAFIPAPLQMVMVVATALWLRVNLPAAFAAILITNPLTMGPIFYMTYRLGVWILGIPEIAEPGSMTPAWLIDVMAQIWKPLLLGSLVTGLIAGALSLVLVDLIWVILVRWKRRKRQRA